MIELISGFLSALLWGFLLSTGITLLTVWLMVQFFNIERLYQLIVGAVLWIFLIFQMSALVSTLKIDGYVEKAQREIATLSNTEDANKAANDFFRDYPIVNQFVDEQELSSGASISAAMLDKAHQDMMSFAWRRVFWSLGFIVLACSICGFFLSRPSISEAQLDPFNTSSGGGSSGIQF